RAPRGEVRDGGEDPRQEPEEEPGSRGRAFDEAPDARLAADRRLISSPHTSRTTASSTSTPHASPATGTRSSWPWNMSANRIPEPRSILTGENPYQRAPIRVKYFASVKPGIRYGITIASGSRAVTCR